MRRAGRTAAAVDPERLDDLGAAHGPVVPLAHLAGEHPGPEVVARPGDPAERREQPGQPLLPLRQPVDEHRAGGEHDPADVQEQPAGGRVGVPVRSRDDRTVVNRDGAGTFGSRERPAPVPPVHAVHPQEP